MREGDAAVQAPDRFSLPNALSLSRLFAVPLLLAAAAAGQPTLFHVVLLYALASDVLDGALARRLGEASVAGAGLDSLADCALYLSLPPAVLLLYPSMRHAAGALIAVVFVAYAAPISYGYVKYRRLTSYHTRAAKIAGVLLSAALLLLILDGTTWLLRVATLVLVASAIEEIAITWRLREWRAEIRSIWSLNQTANRRDANA